MGIDPAKESFTAGRWQPRTPAGGKAQAFANEPSGYEALTRWLAGEERTSAEGHQPSGDVLIAIEQTGSCSMAVWPMGGATTSAWLIHTSMKNSSGGEAKNDAIDSMRVVSTPGATGIACGARAACRGVAHVVPAHPAERLVEHKTALKNMRGEFGARSSTCPVPSRWWKRPSPS